MSNIKLGDLRSGEVEIKAISHQWEEYPQLKSEKLRTDKKLYIELDKVNFNILAEYYRNQVLGDNSEGLATKNSMYYDLFMVKTPQGVMTKSQFIELYPNFDEYIDDSVEDYYTYTVVIF